MRLIFFGTPSFAVLPLASLINEGFDVSAVVTQPDKRSGRRGRVTAPPVKNEALKAGIRVLQPLEIREKVFLHELEAISPDAIVVAAYGKILPPEILKMPPLGCVNIHASLLPLYRGAAPINWAIVNGDEKTGITTMLMDEGMDTGGTLMQEETDILPDDTAGTLTMRLSRLGSELLLKTLRGLNDKTLKPVPQAGEPTFAPVLKKNDGLIDWSRSARDLHNFIRGMNPWPGAYSFMDGQRYKFLRASHEPGLAKPGVIAALSKSSLLVGTAEGVLSVMEIQPSGKKAMPVSAFIQGSGMKEGMRFHD